PTQLGLTAPAQALRDDNQFRALFYSPLRADLLVRRSAIVVAQISSLVLALLTLGSFLVNLRGIRWWRVLIVGAFLGLALYHLRAVPFFAFVAAPILALNVQEAVVRWREAKP